MNNTFNKLIIAFILFTLVSVACDKDEKMTLEMEVYYTVFENIVEKTPKSIKSLFRVPLYYSDQLEYGNQVVVLLKEQDFKLSIDSIISHEPLNFDTNQYFIIGKFIGIDENTKESLIGFEIEVTDSEWSATRSNERDTKIIIGSFEQKENELIFSGIEKINSVNKKPVLLK